MRISLVINPRSGSIDGAGPIVERLGADGADVASFAPGEHASAVLERPDRLVVAGGDGTIGACALEAAEAGIPLAVVPAGTANDFARALGIPLDIDAAITLARDPEARTTPVEVALAGSSRPFVNVASAGLAVRAAREAAGLKARMGPVAYLVGALRAGLGARAVPVSVVADGERWFSGEAWQVVVSGTGRFGGGSAVGETDPDDGRLDITVVPAGPRLALARRAFGLRRGTLGEQDDVPHRRAREVHVDLDGGDGGFNVDGELVDDRVLDFAVSPTRVKVVVP